MILEQCSNGNKLLDIILWFNKIIYVNASICDTNQYLEHICCYEKNYDKIKIGDKVVIAKFKDGNIVAIPTA